MPFLKNAWYAAGWSAEIGRNLLPRRLLDEPVLLYRQTDGTPAAISDRCPHRFVPLHRGTLKGDVVECGYHGLCFAANGACTSNPHGDGRIPAAARVRSFPLQERYGVVWIWMGDPARANTEEVCDFPPFDEGSGFVAVHGYLHVAANYQLFGDNLLDLTHVQYVHPAFANPNATRASTLMDDPGEDGAVWAKYVRPNEPPNAHFQWLGFPRDVPGDQRSFMRWKPPGNYLLDVGMRALAAPVDDPGIAIPTMHLLTPETLTTTHYFWATARNVRTNDTAFGEEFQRTRARIFATEDKPIVELQQAAMGEETDLFKLKPVLLSSDRSAVRARRMMNELIRKEQEAASD